MRKVIAFIVLGAFFSALLSSPAQALNYDPRNPGPDQAVYLHNSTDDSGWADEKTSTQFHIWSFVSGIISSHNPPFLVIGLIVIPTTDVGGDDIGNNERNNAQGSSKL